MEATRVLLLDFCPPGGLGEALRKILEVRTPDRRGAAHTPVEVCRVHSLDGALPASAAVDDSRLTFLALPHDLSGRAGELIAAAKRIAPSSPLVIVAEETCPREMFELLKLGATDFIVPPLCVADVLPRAWRLLEGSAPDEACRRKVKERLGLRQLIGESESFLAEMRKIPLVAKCDARVLITGETGTGKELCARAVHYLSPRTAKPFIPVNCGAIPSELVENELFGHERGAFTGAVKVQRGLIQEAEGGTLFLDEVDCLPPLAQAKLLRFLQEREYRPLGSARMRRTDVRVIAATNVDLGEAVKQGRVRRDFYYRLNIVPLRLPPLRERRSDIGLLAQHFLSKFAVEFGSAANAFSPGAVERLTAYDWPGNVRELEHIVERAVALSEREDISAEELDLPATDAPACTRSFGEAKAQVVARFERQYLLELLLEHRGNITHAAAAARKNRRAFWQLLRKHHINVRDLK
ncbi:MAG TPA: sigma-54 dependent transcriptional regulator [Pyrinomonadaceae bacterium]|nr:sigma-54 dependent transcriptional regulator [Pyrinomonadaceae bacterium]